MPRRRLPETAKGPYDPLAVVALDKDVARSAAGPPAGEHHYRPAALQIRLSDHGEWDRTHVGAGP